MSKISTYPKDNNVTGQDLLVGSDWNTPGKITKNFSTNALASYFNKSAIIDTGQFSWEFLPYNNTQPQPEKTFMKVDWLDDTININNLAGVLRVSALTLGNTQPGAFIENEWVGNNILVHIPNSPSAYAIYTVDALVPDGDWYYLMTLSYVGGQSFTILKNDPVVMGYFAGANVITEITGTFPIIVSEGSIPDVSIDETKLGEWNLAFNSTITSASVTGTTTKTLTLTEQDGGTITASWTDEDTNLVTSVFGRTGAVVAVSGDYNTSQVTESTNLYFTQARAIASPITGYNPAAGTITASDTILTAINKLSGNISGGYVPYTGATTNVNLGEKGITAGYVGFDLTPTGTPTAVGTMYWDTAYRTVSLIDGDGDTTLQIGQEERILVHNNTGSTLTDGQVVYVTGSTGNLPSVSLADASSETTSAATLGVVTESISNGADGFITVSGMVNGLNTLAFAEGDLLWLSETAGQFTNIKPIAPAHLVLIGYVIKRAGGNGSILVKIQNTQELSESSDVLISAPEIDGQGLFLQTISGVQLWRNRSIVDVLGYTPADEATTFTINGTTYDLSANRTWSVGTVTSIAVGLGTSGTDVNVSGSPITSSGTITLNIPSASSVNRGLLTPTDWSTFNNKQDAGNYITSLTGEATASGPGAAAVTLSTPAVTGKLLTGVNITGGTVVATDTILEAFGKVQNQINGLVGGSIYKGTWNAATNTPTITSGVGNTGWYYIVSVAGSTNIDGITDWNLGDWIIFDGTAWQQVDNTDAVVSVNGYTGAVSLVSSDVPEGLTNLYFTNARARGAVSLTTTGSSGAATYDSGTGVFNIPNYGSALTGYVPYSGATTNLDLGGNSLLASTAIFSTGSTNPVITLNNTTGDTSANFTINQGVGFSLNVYNTLSTKAIDLKVGGSSALVVTNGFDVLVGYTSGSGYKLDVNGSGRFIAGASADGVLVTNTGGRGFRVNNNTSGYGLIINNETASTAIPFVIQKNGANRIAFYEDGSGSFSGTVSAPIVNISNTTANNALYVTQTNPGYNAVVITNTGGSALYVTGSATFVNTGYFGGVLTAQSLASTTGQGYTLPTTSGTLALTSQLSSYLPLSGGTLTGALSGTSATFSGNVGVGTASPSDRLNVVVASNGNAVRFDGPTSGLIFQTNATTTDIISYGGSTPAYRALNFSASASTNMTITSSGNVGIGTTSPTALGTGYTTLDIQGSNGGGLFYGVTGNKSFLYADSGGANIGTNASLPLLFLTAGSERMRITSDGIVQLSTTSSIPTTNNSIYSYSGNNFMYIQGGSAGLALSATGARNNIMYLNESSNYIRFDTSGSERMRITSSGNVGIGTTSPSNKLTIAGSSGTIMSLSNGADADLLMNFTSGVTLLTPTTGILAFGTSSTERMRITSAGHVLVGVTSSIWAGDSTRGIIHLNGSTDVIYGLTIGGSNAGYLYHSGSNLALNQTKAGCAFTITNEANSHMTFGTNSTERMRITSGGNVLIGTTSDNGNKFQLNGYQSMLANPSGGGSYGIRFSNNNGAYWEIFNATNFNKFTFIYQGSYIADINSSSGAYTALSDERKKKDIEDSNIGLSTILALQPALFRMKTDQATDVKQLGFIAQQVQSVLPEACSSVGEYLGVQDRPIVAALVKAVQEQQVQIQELKQQLANK
jgi:uncharacterized protein YaiE (UPF0345 family)